MSNSENFRQNVSSLSFKKCYTYRLSTIAFGYAPGVVLMSLHEFIIFPCLRNCLPSIKIYQKLLLGVIIEMV